MIHCVSDGGRLGKMRNDRWIWPHGREWKEWFWCNGKVSLTAGLNSEWKRKLYSTYIFPQQNLVEVCLGPVGFLTSATPSWELPSGRSPSGGTTLGTVDHPLHLPCKPIALGLWIFISGFSFLLISKGRYHHSLNNKPVNFRGVFGLCRRLV